jgi:hypothetical protein
VWILLCNAMAAAAAVKKISSFLLFQTCFQNCEESVSIVPFPSPVR